MVRRCKIFSFGDLSCFTDFFFDRLGLGDFRNAGAYSLYDSYLPTRTEPS